MELSDDLLCLFNAKVEERGDSYVIEVQERELNLGVLQQQSPYRVAILPTQRTSKTVSHDDETHSHTRSEAPVEEGEEVDVKIESLGDQGDGIARVGPGYVVIVPDAEPGDRVTVEITNTRDTVAFADIVDGPY